MAEKLKITPLGGMNEIGKNIYVYESMGDLLVVDCGLAFPDEEMYGVDYVIPDISYLVKHKNRIRGIVITHGHEDHIGSLPYLLREVNAPVYCTKLTAGLIEIKLEEAGLLSKTKLIRVEAGQNIFLGCFNVEFIRVNHSIADAVSLAITTPVGVVIHTGDFKLDTTPVQGDVIDLARFGELGKNGVLALLSDSTNVERPGYSMSERKVGDSFDALFKSCDSRIIVTTFASNVHRIQQVIDSAAKYNRRVAITGRSMENIMRVATNLGYMTIPPNTLIELNQIKDLPKNKVVIITTGSQGEPMSALHRMAFSSHRQIEISSGDRVIISASPIPGNEKTIGKVINELFKRGAEVVYEKLADIHVSGHACQEELKLMLALTKPQYFMPMHGEFRHLRAHALLGRRMGMGPKNVFIGENGRSLEITRTSARLAGTVHTGAILVDGAGLGDVGLEVMRDRKHLATDGLIVVTLVVSMEQSAVAVPPDITCRGFIFQNNGSDTLIDDLRRITMTSAETSLKSSRDLTFVKAQLREVVASYLHKKTRRSPVILITVVGI